jgi:hypothetical protein
MSSIHAPPQRRHLVTHGKLLSTGLHERAIDAEEVMAILGEHWFMTTVWGCAFEDFLTRESVDGRNTRGRSRHGRNGVAVGRGFSF